MITYLTGDATHPQVEGSKIIAHVCNDVGAWGRGFVLSLSSRWPEAEHAYRRWYQDQENTLVNPELSDTMTIGVRLATGNVQYVRVDRYDNGDYFDFTYVANMVGQHGIMTKDGVPPIRYDALKRCLIDVAGFARDLNASIHMPRIGCGLAGGRWSEVEKIIERILGEFHVYVYDIDTDDERTIPWKQ